MSNQIRNYTCPKCNNKTCKLGQMRATGGTLSKIFDIQNGITEAKNMIIGKLQQVEQVARTFIKTDSGYRITAPEGFVAIDHLKGNAVKLVDRLEFSQANFNAAKNWSK